MDFIRVVDVLKTMEMQSEDGYKIPFSITFVTCDLKKDEGGNKITLSEAILVGGVNSASKTKNPNHYDNYTRNIRAANGDYLIKIHPILVTRFNGRRICQ